MYSFLDRSFAFHQQDDSSHKSIAPQWLESLPLVTEADDLANYQGYFAYQQVAGEDALSFFAQLDKQWVSISVDLVGGQVAYRRQQGGGRKQHIAKACGLKSNRNPTVLDATGGLGRDAAELRNLGCELRVVERSPYVASLLQDAISRAQANPETNQLFSQGFELHHGQAIDLIEQLSAEQQPDIIYLDPMFPPRNKSAAVKKEMRLVKRLVGEDPDADNLLPVALANAAKRVVVKRPSYAPYLNQQKPSMSIESKGNRFDVYLMTRFSNGN
ncbi:class I SAM-dependent methyltransferase [Kangiella sp. TOML190]|uniref:class I SAM-dependent methyltransferase n=1 Tax=Kangiella sp. TOML190 TaxID=2931351 RepID=UPI00203E8800|nr:class I SAM-dependent methyltransferase [Kangiella sp. TOML190]